MSTNHLPLMAMGLGGAVASPLLARKQADVAVPSFQDQLALTVFRQVLQQMDASDLYRELGSQRVCDLVKHLLKTTEGRNLMLTCVYEPSCESSWQRLDMLTNVSYDENLDFYRGYLIVNLARQPRIIMRFIRSDFRTQGRLFQYELPIQGNFDAHPIYYDVTHASQLSSCTHDLNAQKLRIRRSVV